MRRPCWSRNTIAVGLVGVAGDVEAAEVMIPVTTPAQHDEVPGVGAAAVGPVHDVVDFEPAGRPAQRVTALLVTVQHDPPGAFGNDPLGAADTDRTTIGHEDRADRAVTGVQPGDGVGHGDAIDPRHRRRQRGVDEQVDAVTLTSLHRRRIDRRSAMSTRASTQVTSRCLSRNRRSRASDRAASTSGAVVTVEAAVQPPRPILIVEQRQILAQTG